MKMGDLTLMKFGGSFLHLFKWLREKAVKFWQSLAMVEIDELPRLAEAAEEVGFEGVVLSDHLVTFSEQYDKYYDTDDEEIVWYADTHWPDPFVQIGALAQVTKKLKFMVGVYVLPLRDPFSVAKAISTAAIISNNRLHLGIGVGWQKAEFKILDKNFHDRGRRSDEMLSVIKKLITGKEVEHHGEFFDFDRLRMSPGVSADIPVLVGGLTDMALCRAANNDGWIGVQHDVDQVGPMINKLKSLRENTANPGKLPFEIVISVRNPSRQALKVARDMGVTAIYRDAWLDENSKASVMSLQQKIDSMRRFADENFL